MCELAHEKPQVVFTDYEMCTNHEFPKAPLPSPILSNAQLAVPQMQGRRSTQLGTSNSTPQQGSVPDVQSKSVRPNASSEVVGLDTNEKSFSLLEEAAKRAEIALLMQAMGEVELL